MRIIDHIKKRKSSLFSFEIIPPPKGASLNDFCKTIEPLINFSPSFIDVTYHREEYVYKMKENGLLLKQSVRKRPGTVGICAAIKNRFNIDPVPHLICGGFTKEETENALIDLDFLEIQNLLVLRGDPVKSEKNFVPEKEGHAYAIDLLGQVVQMNEGKYLNNYVENPSSTGFCPGVAVYPEKHIESPNLDRDIKLLKKKVEKGAEFAITQMFFDNNVFFSFVEKCRKEGINIPIIPGLKPITLGRHLSVLPLNFHVDIPSELTQFILNAKTEKEITEIGTEWCIHQAKELIKHDVPCLHFYTMSKARIIKKIMKAVY